MVTRRQFLHDAGLVTAFSLLPVRLFRRQPQTVALFYGGLETSGPGYTRKQLTGVRLVENDGPKYWAADDTTWTGATFAADELRVYDSSGQRIADIAFGFGPVRVDKGTFTVEWSESALTITI